MIAILNLFLIFVTICLALSYFILYNFIIFRCFWRDTALGPWECGIPIRILDLRLPWASWDATETMAVPKGPGGGLGDASWHTRGERGHIKRLPYVPLARAPMSACTFLLKLLMFPGSPQRVCPGGGENKSIHLENEKRKKTNGKTKNNDSIENKGFNIWRLVQERGRGEFLFPDMFCGFLLWIA